MYLVTATQMQSLDRRTIEEAKVPATTLMERAGMGVARAMEQAFGSPSGKRVTILCGKGNNGGDGLVLARLLRRKRARVQVLLFANPKELTGSARSMYRRIIKTAGTAIIKSLPTEEIIRTRTAQADFLVDALLGTGLSSPVTGHYREAIEAINASPARTIAIDLPSGIHSDHGAILGAAVQAKLTVTFGCPKVGLYLGSAIDHTGTISTVDIGIPQEYVEDLSPQVHLLTPPLIKSLLPTRAPTSHKGTFGHAGIIAGSPGKTGAAALAAKAALRTGTGLVTVATPITVNPIVESALLEAMTVPMPETEAHTLGISASSQLVDFANERSAVAIGPGLGTHPETGQLLQSFLPRLHRPCVIDADALNLLGTGLSDISTAKLCHVLTPHPGEMARLLGDTTPQAVNEHRLTLALQFARAHGVIVVLKGARTVIASPDGQSAVCPTGNPGMATAGMGDALTGMIVGLLAQGLSPWNAARSGVFLHGLAGDRAAEKLGHAGLIASDLIESIPHAFQQTLA